MLHRSLGDTEMLSKLPKLNSAPGVLYLDPEPSFTLDKVARESKICKARGKSPSPTTAHETAPIAKEYVNASGDHGIRTSAPLLLSTGAPSDIFTIQVRVHSSNFLDLIKLFNETIGPCKERLTGYAIVQDDTDKTSSVGGDSRRMFSSIMLLEGAESALLCLQQFLSQHQAATSCVYMSPHCCQPQKFRFYEEFKVLYSVDGVDAMDSMANSKPPTHTHQNTHHTHQPTRPAHPKPQQQGTHLGVGCFQKLKILHKSADKCIFIVRDSRTGTLHIMKESTAMKQKQLAYIMNEYKVSLLHFFLR